MSSPLADVVAGARRALELEWASEEQRDLELTEAEKWARDPVGWINEHVWIASFLPSEGHDRQRIRRVKMTLFADQEATIAAWIDLDHLAATGQARPAGNVIIEKSRQIGETWAMAAVLAWLIHHHPVTALAMHVKLDEIDDGGKANTHKSLFGKVRYIDGGLSRDRLPYLGTLTFKQKPSKIESSRGAVVYGEGQNDDPGRGQSLDFVLVDEAARVEHGEFVHSSLSISCSDGKVYLSTPKGSHNMHARIARTKPLGWTYLRLHWSTHPVYSRGLHTAGQDPTCALCEGNRQGVRWEASEPRAHRYPGKLTSPWYELQLPDLTDEQVAAELDIDREGSLPGRVFPEFDRGVHVVDEGIPYSPDVPVELAWDYGTDTTAIIVLQNAPDSVRAIGLLEMGTQHGTTDVVEHVAAELRLLLQELGLPPIETEPFYTAKLRAIGDPAGHSKQLGRARTLASQYRRQGFQIGKPPTRYRFIEQQNNAVKRLLLGSPKPLRICGVHAAALGDHLAANRWKTLATGEVQFGSAMDIHDDVHNHSVRALSYWTTATFHPPGEDDAGQPAAEADELHPAEERLDRRRRRARGGHLHDLDDSVGPDMRL